MRQIIEYFVRRTRLYQGMVSKRQEAEGRARRIEAENRELDERVAAISRRLCEVSVQRPQDGRPHLRICLDISTLMIERGFLHGDDRTMIEYIGRDIGLRATEEILKANFARWSYDPWTPAVPLNPGDRVGIPDGSVQTVG